MKITSPDEILKKSGKWINRDTFIKLVAEERHVGNRQAWNIINKESHAIKHVYTDRTTVYGLEEFGPPKPKIEGNFHRFGFFQWLNARAERQKKEHTESRKEVLLDKIHYEELLAETYPKTFDIMKKCAEQDREMLKLLEKEED